MTHKVCLCTVTLDFPALRCSPGHSAGAFLWLPAFFLLHLLQRTGGPHDVSPLGCLTSLPLSNGWRLYCYLPVFQKQISVRVQVQLLTDAVCRLPTTTTQMQGSSAQNYPRNLGRSLGGCLLCVYFTYRVKFWDLHTGYFCQL